MVFWTSTVTFGELLTATSIAVGIIVFFVRSIQATRQERRDTTFRLLSRIFESGPVSEARLAMARWIALERELGGDLIDNDPEDRIVMTILDFYEFTCEGAHRGVVDKRLLNQESGGRMERTFFLARKYIHAREVRLNAINKSNGRPPITLYRHLRKFLENMRKLDTTLVSEISQQAAGSELYFAFGSNMSRRQIEERVGPVALVGTGRLQDHQLVFNRKGTYRDGGVASVEPQRGGCVEGVIWRLPRAALDRLDVIEDPSAYKRTSVPVQLSGGDDVTCQVYVAVAEGEFEPDAEYLDIVIRAAREQKLSDAYIERLEALSSARDRS